MTQYEVEHEIGDGTFGNVFAVKREEDGKSLAVKELKEKFLQEGEEEIYNRFKREVRLQAQLDHPSIVPVIDMRLDDDPPWYVMPRAIGSLDELITENNENHLPIFESVAEALSFAHQNKVIHRDLKPENILIFSADDGLTVAVSDFGLGKSMDTSAEYVSTSPHARMGTFPYAAPEQMEDAKKANEKSDIYSMGQILYEMLSGVTPYPPLDFENISGGYQFIIQKATEGEPEDRYESVEEMMERVKLVRDRPTDFQKPIERAEELKQQVIGDEGLNEGKLESLTRHVLENIDDHKMKHDFFPKIPKPILREMVNNHKSSFKDIFEEYDDHVSGELVFEYCDIVADFYKRVFFLTVDDEIKRMILNRLPRMGHKHNRFHVGDVLAAILKQIDDPALFMVIEDVFTSEPEIAKWCKSYLKEVSLPSMIRDTL